MVEEEALLDKVEDPKTEAADDAADDAATTEESDPAETEAAALAAFCFS